ncbi:MAG: flippase activity-associated protein Agl23 [Caldilinea sp.]
MTQDVSTLDKYPPEAAPQVMSLTSTSWLDRPLSSMVALSWETLAWVGIFLAGVVTRFYNLGARAMSHDESLHALYSYYLYANGNYDHNPMMHGPFLFHANALIYFLFGDSDFTARMAPAIFGMGTLAMIYALRPYLGRTGALVAGVLVLVSPSLLFHSRYIRNDIYIAFDTLVWIYGAFRYLDTRKLRYLVIMMVGMALGFITKEVHFMHGAIIGAFFAGLALWQMVGPKRTLLIAAPLVAGGAFWWVLHEMKNDLVGMIGLGVLALVAIGVMVYFLRGRWADLRRNPAADLTVIMVTLVLPFLSPFVFVFTGGDPAVFTSAGDYTNQDMIIRLGVMVGGVVAAAVGLAIVWFGRRHEDADHPRVWRPHLGHWAMLRGGFWLIQVIFFTTFFTNTVNGLATGVVGSLGYWLAQQGVKRGSQPVYYYALIGWLYEFLPAMLSLGAMATIAYNLIINPLRRVLWDPVVRGDLPAGNGARGEGRGAQDEHAAIGEDAIPDEDARLNRILFVVFGVWWVVASWIAYSVAGEKMPWLLVHIALPMTVLGGWWLGYVLRRIDWRAAWREKFWLLTLVFPMLVLLGVVMLTVLSGAAGVEGSAAGRILQWLLIFAALGAVVFGGVYGILRVGFQAGMRLLAVGLAGVLLLFTIRTSFTLTFINYDMATEFLVYAHGGPDVKRALAELDTISERTAGDRNLVVAYDNDSAWPFSWYMRLFRNAKYYGDAPSPDAMAAPVVIVGPENRAKVEPYMARDYVKHTYRRIWWPEMDYFDLTPDRVWGALTDPAQRQRLFDIIFFRKYRDPQNLAQFRDLAKWPYQGEFDMYVRRDLAAQIWDLGVTPIATESTLDIPVIEPGQVRFVTAQAVYDGDYNGLPFFAPRAVAIAPNGDRVIADTNNHRIVVLNNAGEFLRAFGGYCNVNDQANTPCLDPDGDGPLVSGDGQFFEPWGVAVDASGQIYVADTWNGRIQVFDAEGNLLRKWGTFASTNGELGDPLALFGPRGMSIDLDGNLLVADTGNKRIVRFSPTGEALGQIGGGGVIAGRFEEPTDVDVDPRDGTVLVADAWNGRVQRFSPDLTYLSEFGVPGWAGRDVFQKPYLAVAADGAIYATDPATALVMVFNPDGAVRAAFGGSGSDMNHLGQPNGVAVDLAGGVVVAADGGNNRVMVFPEIRE